MFYILILQISTDWDDKSLLYVVIGNFKMRLLIIALLVLLITPSFGQKVALKNKEFLLIKYELDGHGEWLKFVNDSICIRSIGSVSWGTSQDTLKYKIDENLIYFKGLTKFFLKSNKLEIQRIDSSEFTQNRLKYATSRKYYCELDRDTLKDVIVLKLLK